MWLLGGIGHLRFCLDVKDMDNQLLKNKYVIDFSTIKEEICSPYPILLPVDDGTKLTLK